ncbi:ABC transporter permease [Romboutsia sp.]|uniref:ABC transporter permease n=1 Tax=Romboutsia sp. TaxID=1965302 RepID=UPI003F32E38A
MNNIMTILKHNLKTTLKGWFWLILVLPIGVNLFVNIISDRVDKSVEDSGKYFNVGIYTKDKSEIVEKLLPKDKFKTRLIKASEKDLRGSLDNGDISVGVIIDSEDIYKDIKANKEDSIKVISQSKGNNKDYVLGILNTRIMQANSLGDNKEEYLKAYESYEKNKYKIDYEGSEMQKIMPYTTMFGLFTMAFLFIGGRCLVPLLKEREAKIDKRILVSKISKPQYLLGHILGCYILLVLQSVILVATFYILNPSLNISLGWMIILSLALSFMGIAIALTILSVSNNSSMYYTLLSILITPMCLLSGGFVPMALMPEVIQNISLVFPLTWINSAYTKILFNGDSLSIGLDLLAAISISLVLIIMYLVIENRKGNKLSC